MKRSSTSPAEHQQWRAYLALTFVSLLSLILIFRETAGSMLEKWLNSETYAHGFIIVPISLYLIWRERAYLRKLTPSPSALGLAALALLGICWMIAQSAGVQVIAQYMFVAMIPALVASLLGWRLVRAMAFPLAFMLLAVPFGEVFLRPMIDFTADFTVYALQLTGIPVFREGSHLSLPSGDWMVAEACSGLRYLIASFTLGCLYAHLTYRSLHRKLLFIIASIIVPIIANAVRAYLIVLLGHVSNMTLAVGVDHLIYGWVFFGFVMLLLFWAGSRWREDDAEASTTAPSDSDTRLPTSTGKAAGFALAALAILWAAPAYLLHLERQSYNPAQVTLALPQTLSAPRHEWTASPASSGLKPIFPGAAATLMQEYRNGDQVIGIYLAFFRNQQQNAEAVSSQNILATERASEWNVASVSTHDRLSAPARVQQTRLIWGGQKMLAWQWYWISGVHTANPYQAKFLQAKERLLMQGGDSADVVIFAPYNMPQDKITSIMDDFLTLAVPAIQQSLTTASGQ